MSMKILQGVSVFPGIAEGVICQYLSESDFSIPQYEISPSHVESEKKRVEDAFLHALRDMQQTIIGAETIFDQEILDIFKVHLMIIKNDSIRRKVLELIENRLINGEHAVKEIFDEYAAQFAQQQGHFAELAHDYVDIQERILRALNVDSGRFACPVGDRGAVIVAAGRLTPSLVTSLDKKNVLAFIAEEGGLTSHATILARAFHVPIVLGVKVKDDVICGVKAVVDGSLGKVILEPDKETSEYYEQKLETLRERRLVCEGIKDQKAQTGEGQRVGLKLNISSPAEVDALDEVPVDGIGLLRTEFLFSKRKQAPSEDEQCEMYKRIFESVDGSKVTVRLLDISSDKLPSYISLPSDYNLDLTLRGALSVSVFEPLFLSQFKALLRANTRGNLRILYPMVSDLSDLDIYRGLKEKAVNSLREEGLEFSMNSIEEGVMIETPSAVMLIDELFEQVDFVNIGSNDLVQYALAASRGNVLVEKQYHILHPSLAKMIKIVSRAGIEHGKEVCLCGEIASFAEYYPLLLDLGLRSFSVSPGVFDDIKCALAHFDVHVFEAHGLAEEYVGIKGKTGADRFFEKYL